MKKLGIDVSAWQGNYNFTKAKNEGVQFVILKGGGGDDGYYLDSRFIRNYNTCKNLGLPVGVYWFSRALNITQAKAEAKWFYENCLKGRKFELPVYIDVENRAQLAIGRRALTDVIKAWCQYLEKLGYYTGIYSSASFFQSYMYDSELKNYAHWVAQWSTIQPNAGLWQFGGETNYLRNKKIAGQTVDQDYLLTDYTAIIKSKGLNGFAKTATTAAKPTKKEALTVDGEFGYKSTVAAQKWIGTYADGVISGQLAALASWYPALLTAEFSGGGSAFVEALQKFLKKKGYDIGKSGVDGLIGHDVVLAVQKALNKALKLKLKEDGIFGAESAKAAQRYLNTVM